jgi:hypothetical protein
VDHWAADMSAITLFADDLTESKPFYLQAFEESTVTRPALRWCSVPGMRAPPASKTSRTKWDRPTDGTNRKESTHDPLPGVDLRR